MIGTISSIFLVSCDRKAIEDIIKPEEKVKQPTLMLKSLQLTHKVNPMSLQNIQLAKQELGSTTEDTQIYNQNLHIYFKFNPSQLPQALFKNMEADTSLRLLDFPFADGSIYGDDVAFDATKAAQLADGSIWGVTNLHNPIVQDILRTNEISPVVLDTLYLPNENQESLILQAIARTSGETRENLARRICRRRPSGRVRYRDSSLGNQMLPVVNIQVWVLHYGVPKYTYTDANGAFSMPYNFIVGTHAKNYRVNVKPLNTSGSIVGNILNILSNFVVGSVHVEGWIGSCSINNITIDFNNHMQNRYWAQLLNAVYFHDVFCNQERINSAPFGLTVYAQWSNVGNNAVDLDPTGTTVVPGFGSASMPLLGHLNANYALLEVVFNAMFDNEINLATSFPNLFNILTGLLPDMTMRVPAVSEPPFYCERLAQIAHHELSHGSHYMQAGQGFWYALITASVFADGVQGNPYGNGTANMAGYLAVAESWAEFLGTNFAIRRYPNGVKRETSLGIGAIYQPMAFLREEEEFWFDWGWIPSGLYHDLIDANGAGNTEWWDNAQGFTIRQLYELHGPEVTDMCAYSIRFMETYPQAWTTGGAFEVFLQHNAICQ